MQLRLRCTKWTLPLVLACACTQTAADDGAASGDDITDEGESGGQSTDDAVFGSGAASSAAGDDVGSESASEPAETDSDSTDDEATPNADSATAATADQEPTDAKAATGDPDATAAPDSDAGSMGVGGGANEPSADGSGAVAPTPDDSSALFVPSHVQVLNVNGEGKAVNVVASTLIAGPSGPELYAVLSNSADVSACDGSISFELFDGSELSVGAWTTAIHSGQLYRRADGMGGIIACLDPGEVAMAALTDLPQDLVLDDLSAVVYYLTYFDRDVLPFETVPVDGVQITNIRTVELTSTSAFTGTLANGLDVPMNGTTVTVYGLNDAGRPVSMATSTSSADIPAGESWDFESTPVNDPGTDHLAFPSASVSFEP
jgi:hypothetical protein